MPLLWLGIASVVLISISDISYVRAIWKGDAKPHRFTWFIFLMTALITFGSQWQLGSREGLFVFGWFVVINATILVLSLLPRRGAGGFDLPNTVALVLAGVSIMLWYGIDASWGLVCILVADTIGITLTVLKTWRNPYTEPKMMWGLGSLAALLNVFAVGSLTPILLLAPIHLLACDVAVFGTILWRRKTTPATA